MSRNEPLLKRFMKKVVVSKFTDCHIWIGGRFRSGYGDFRSYKKERRAHRAAWDLLLGDIPEGLQVLHKCDNRLCVNPDHLYLGSNYDNMQDKIRKGRGRNQYGRW